MTTTRIEGASSLVDQVLTLTRHRILSGEYPPGSRLPVHMLAEESGASLIPVREALRILEAERLVESFPNRGARVTPLSLDDMRDLYSVRTLLETETLRRARPLEPDDVIQLTELLDRMQEAVAADDIDLMMLLHRQYHFALYTRTDSSWMPHIIDVLWKHAERYQRLALAFRHDGADLEHRSVLEALARGDNERAAEDLRSHLETTARLVIAAHMD
jgi:DNA-binding GntR family transcriptional regulator